MSIKLTDVIIFSTQRSGSHLLQDLLNSHPDINIRGEIFLHYRKGIKLHPHVEGKVNIAILQYSQLESFYELGGDLKKIKIIHLLRNPLDVAISRLQLKVDREIDKNISAHHRSTRKKEYGKRGIIDEGLIDSEIKRIELSYNSQKELLKNIDHLEINYEDFTNGGNNTEYLNDDIAKKILNYLNLKYHDRLHTTLLITGIYKDVI